MNPLKVAIDSEFSRLKIDDKEELQLYWLDAHEENNNLYLFGRTKQGNSCCVTINVRYSIFILPKQGSDIGSVL